VYGKTLYFGHFAIHIYDHSFLLVMKFCALCLCKKSQNFGLKNHPFFRLASYLER